jgi:Aldo/keto reductases, related to diketogulonate reductase
MKGEELCNAVGAAFRAGYRHFDLARAYFNEEDFRKALTINAINRDDIFITSKFNVFNEHENIEKELNETLHALDTEYIDLYLMHWPHPKNYIDAWHQLEQLYFKKKARAIGVCNFRERHLHRLLEVAEIIPAINQIENHPLFQLPELIKFCKDKGIQVEAYCPLALNDQRLLESELLIKLSLKYKKTISQIILRWHLDRVIIPVPKSKSPERIAENCDVFDFTLQADEIEAINAMNIGYKAYPEETYCPGYWE